MKFLKLTIIAFVAALLLTTTSNAQSLDELLQQVRSDKASAQAEQAKRINEFRNNRDKQEELMRQIEALVAEQDALSNRLSIAFDANEVQLTDLETKLANRLGDLGEVVGAVRQIASDSSGIISGSLVSAGNPERSAVLSQLSESTDYPSIEELESMWLTLLEEIAKSGTVEKFTATIRDVEGKNNDAEVIRIGTFNAISNDKYLGYSAIDNKLYEFA